MQSDMNSNHQPHRKAHVTAAGKPRMINVAGKPVTHRKAVARIEVVLPDQIFEYLSAGEIQTPKGAVFATAVIAGTMAAKKTSDLIPFCHPIPVEDCRISISLEKSTAVVTCSVETHAKTGVEMEALTGAATAALTIYDMCKGVAPGIIIDNLRLLEKTDGSH